MSAAGASGRHDGIGCELGRPRGIVQGFSAGVVPVSGLGIGYASGRCEGLLRAVGGVRWYGECGWVRGCGTPATVSGAGEDGLLGTGHFSWQVQGKPRVFVVQSRLFVTSSTNPSGSTSKCRFRGRCSTLDMVVIFEAL